MNYVHVGWWCPKNDHITRKPCFTSNIPLYVETSDVDAFTQALDDAGPGCG